MAAMRNFEIVSDRCNIDRIYKHENRDVMFLQNKKMIIMMIKTMITGATTKTTTTTITTIIIIRKVDFRIRIQLGTLFKFITDIKFWFLHVTLS
jgi:hypothetical protein